MRVIVWILNALGLVSIVAIAFFLWLAYGWWSVPAVPCLILVGHAYGKRAEGKRPWRENGPGEQRPTMHDHAVDFTPDEYNDD